MSPDFTKAIASLSAFNGVTQNKIYSDEKELVTEWLKRCTQKRKFFNLEKRDWHEIFIHAGKLLITRDEKRYKAMIQAACGDSEKVQEPKKKYKYFKNIQPEA